MIHENCLDSRGQIRLRYFTREVYSVTAFYMQTFFSAMLLGCISISVLVTVDSYVDLGIIERALVQFDWDLGQWRRNLTTSPENIKEQFTNFHLAHGGTRATARNAMVLL
ncbi:MAG: hypothetical protein KDB00_24825 [Planctomycetales bacterium]|nr:hypothetical protein [Planctomycetales bacterium]